MNNFFSFGITALGLAMITTLGYPAEVEASGGSYQQKSRSRASSRAPSFDNTKSRNIKRTTAPLNKERNQNLYNEGKNILLGTTPLAKYSESLAQEQLRSLNEVAVKLPSAAQKRLNVEEIAGRLSPDQLAAVKYYLKTRYLQ